MVVLTAKVDFKKMMLILGAAAVVLLALILFFGGSEQTFGSALRTSRATTGGLLFSKASAGRLSALRRNPARC